MQFLNGRKGATLPKKATLYRLVKENGAQSILGRALTPKEATEMQIVSRIEQAYYGRQRATNEAAWANSDPGGFKLLMWAEKVADGKRS